MGVVTRSQEKKRKLGVVKHQGMSHEDVEGIDFISHLPDDIIGTVISFLPTDDAIRTSTLSLEWYNKWRSAPLNIDDRYISGATPDIRIGIITHILSEHMGPLHRLAISNINFADFYDTFDGWLQFYATFDGWLQSPKLNKLQELEFNFGNGLHGHKPPLPPTTHRFFPTLRVAIMGGCHIHDETIHMFHLPMLEQLTLERVTISEETIQSMLVGCPALDTLLLSEIAGCRHIQIISGILKIIGVRVGRGRHRLKKIIIEAPSLERLLYLDRCESLQVSLGIAPKLKVLGVLYKQELSSFEVGPVNKGLLDISMADTMSSVKVFALTTSQLSLEKIIPFLRIFPCLEKLYCESTEQFGPKNALCDTNLDDIGCLDLHLKKIVLTNYAGNVSHVNFAMFFLVNAKVLESMRLELWNPENNCTNWIARQSRRLQHEERASSYARVTFATRKCWSKFATISRACDLSIADPFLYS